MITTITALVTLMTAIQSWMIHFEMGRTWAIPTNMTSVQLEMAKAPCCEYLKDETGTIIRTNNVVFLIKVR